MKQSNGLLPHVFLCLMLAITLMIGVSAAEEATTVASGSCGENLTWTLDEDGLLHISGTGEMTGFWPETEVPWYDYCTNITSVVIDEGVTSIGRFAFQGCSSLVSATLPESMVDIWDYAFHGCSSLSSIVIPEGVTWIGYSAFYQCKSLYSVTFPETLTRIGSYSFCFCSNLMSIDIPESVTEIEAYAFYYTGLQNITWPETLTNIADSAFSGCSLMSSLCLPEKVTNIGGSAFSGWSGMTYLRLPLAVTSIGSYAFDYCTSLSTVDAPCTWDGTLYTFDEGVQVNPVLHNMVDGACTLCGGDSCEELGHVFEDGVCTRCGGTCATLGHIYQNGACIICGAACTHSFANGACTECGMACTHSFEEGACTICGVTCADLGHSFENGSCIRCGLIGGTSGDDITWMLNNGVLTISGTGAIKGMPWNEYMDAITTVIIEDGVTEIQCQAFYGFPNLTSATIADSVTEIAGAFSGCTSLTDVRLPANLVSLYDSTFSYCTSLQSITLPEGLETLGNYVFNACSSLSSIEIPSTVTEIGSCVFRNCGLLDGTVVIPEGVTVIPAYMFAYCYELDGVVFKGEVTEIRNNAFECCSSLAFFELPETLNYIGGWAFSDCRNYSGDLVIPDTVTTIDAHAFECTGLTSVTLPEGLTSIGYYMFYACRRLERVVIPSTVTEIWPYAFSGCSKLASVEIPAGVTSIGESAFYGTAITSVTLPAGLTELTPYVFSQTKLTSVTIHANIATVGNRAFQSCGALTGVTIESGVQRLEASVFNNCQNLTSVTLPDSVTSLGNFLFMSCRSLTGVDLPDNLTELPSSLFDGCSSLAAITIPDGVTTIGSSAFSGCTSLTSISFPDSVTEVGPYLLNGCSSLTSVRLPQNIAVIPYGVFANCNALEEVEIPASVTEIGEMLFYEVKKTVKVIFAGDPPVFNENTFIDTMHVYAYYHGSNPAWTETILSSGYGGNVTWMDLDGLYLKNALEDVWAKAGEQATLTVEAGGEGLQYAWYVKDADAVDFTCDASCTGNTYSATMSDASNERQVYCVVTDASGAAVQSITVTLYMGEKPLARGYTGDNRWVLSKEYVLTITGDGWSQEYFGEEFSGYREQVKSVIIKPGVTGIGEFSFWCMPLLTSVSIPDTVTSIWRAAFAESASLKEITIPASVTVMDDDVFAFGGLTSITFEGDVPGDERALFGYDPREITIYYHDSNPTWTDEVKAEFEEYYDITWITLESLGVSITRQPADAKAPEGGIAEVTVEAAGTDLTYEWYFRNAGAAKFSKTNTFTGSRYYITMNATRDGREVYCVITDAYGNSVQSDTVTLTMAKPVAITTQPVDVAVRMGETAKITVIAEGDELTYEWYFRNADAEKFSKTATFTGDNYYIVMNESRHGRQVYCVVTDKYGNTAISDTVTLSVAPVTIVQQPVDVKVAEGEVAEITVIAEGEGLTYAWYFKNAGAAKFSLTNGFSGNRYYVDMNATRNGRQVYVVITDQYGNSVQSDTVTLSMAKPVTITEQPVDVKVPAGETAKIVVTAEGDGLTYAWYFKNAGAAKFSRTSTFSGDTYSVEMNETRDGRQVYVVITDQYGNSVQSDTVTLTMAKPVTITVQPVDVKAPAGETAKIVVTAEGDGLTYAWYFKNAGAAKFSRTTTFSGDAYSVEMNETRDGRQVYVVITDQYGSSVQSDTVTLTMAKPVTITSQPEDAYAYEGDKAVVTFEAEGDGLTYAWYFKNAAATKFSLTTSFTANSYSLEMNASRDGRQIYCVVTDQYGNTATTDTVTLHLVDSVVITKQPVSVSVGMGERAEVSLTAMGEGLTYQWYFKNATASKFSKTTTFTSNLYYITMTEVRAGRQVYCVVTDAEGNEATSDTVTLSVSAEAAEKDAVLVISAGDVNGDGLINMLDVIDYTAWLAGEEVFLIAENADVNGDGAANVQDVNLLMTLCCEVE